MKQLLVKRGIRIRLPSSGAVYYVGDAIIRRAFQAFVGETSLNGRNMATVCGIAKKHHESI